MKNNDFKELVALFQRDSALLHNLIYSNGNNETIEALLSNASRSHVCNTSASEKLESLFSEFEQPIAALSDNYFELEDESSCSDSTCGTTCGGQPARQPVRAAVTTRAAVPVGVPPTHYQPQ